MRLIDAGSVTKKGEELIARFVIGGREVSYQIRIGSSYNPLFLPALEELQMPDGVLEQMAFGVFGKLPQKRDFIALNIPRMVLEPFETWLQSAVAASRSELGAAWQELYLVSPIWRFWIGGDIFGIACAGALIPSVDKVGRFFPLAILYCADDRAGIVAPPFDPLDAWYAAIEERLLSVLQDNAEIEVDRLTDGLAGPRKRSGAAGAAARKSQARARLAGGERRVGGSAFGADGSGLLGLGAGAEASGGRMAAAAAARWSMSATRCLIHFSMQT